MEHICWQSDSELIEELYTSCKDNLMAYSLCILNLFEWPFILYCSYTSCIDNLMAYSLCSLILCEWPFTVTTWR